MIDPIILLSAGAAFVMLATLTSLSLSCYQKCGPNQAMIISGLGTATGAANFKIVIGGGAVVFPVIQQRSFLSLEIMTFDVKSQIPMVGADGEVIDAEGVASIRINGDEASIATAAEMFLDKADSEIVTIAHEELVRALRLVLAEIDVERLSRNPDEYAEKVLLVSTADLRKFGLTVVSFSFKRIAQKIAK